MNEIVKQNRPNLHLKNNQDSNPSHEDHLEAFGYKIKIAKSVSDKPTYITLKDAVGPTLTRL